MKRSDARELAVLLSFSSAFDSDFEGVLETFFEPEHFSSLALEGEAFAKQPSEEDLSYIKNLVGLCCEHKAELDGYIEKYSQGWKLPRISKSAQAILRISMSEILYIDDVPVAVAINEAVELAKKYEEEKTVSFINGILGSFVREELSDTAE